MKRALAVTAVLIVLFAACSVVVLAVTGRLGGVEVEDCDAEDRRNREAECGFAPTPKASKTPKPKATPTPKRSSR